MIFLEFRRIVRLRCDIAWILFDAGVIDTLVKKKEIEREKEREREREREKETHVLACIVHVFILRITQHLAIARKYRSRFSFRSLVRHFFKLADKAKEIHFTRRIARATWHDTNATVVLVFFLSVSHSYHPCSFNDFGSFIVLPCIFFYIAAFEIIFRKYLLTSTCLFDVRSRVGARVLQSVFNEWQINGLHRCEVKIMPA